MQEFVFGKVRIQLLQEGIVRLERMRKGKFCNGSTLFVPDRPSKGWKEQALLSEEGERLCISLGEYTLVLRAGGGTLAGARLERGGRAVWRYKRFANSGELPRPGSTPEVFALSDAPRILLPEGGYSFRSRKHCGYRIEENAEDVYLLLCGKNAKALRRLYVQLTGRCALVRLSTLGLWDSRYYEYNEESAKQRILDYERRGVPLDNIVIDTDWRAASDRGIGYDVNTKLFPDLARFFAFAHEHGVEVMFNDHPEPVEGAQDVFDPAEVRFREQMLRRLMALGLDTWWYDRNWHTKLRSPCAGILPETLGMYLFEEITRRFYQERGSDRVYRRPVIMANVSNVENGAYEGEGERSIRDSASHRFSIQWTGDVPTDLSALGSEVETLVSAGANCIAYLHADCGGHTAETQRNDYIRWMQFGALSPVLRPHCTKGLRRTREPWAYDEETFRIVREYILLRYRLLPYLYALAHESYETGVPMCRALGFEYPEDRRACRETSEYLLGRELLAAPVARYRGNEDGFFAEAREVYLPKGKWINLFTGKVYAGGRAHAVPCPIEQMPLFVREGALIPLARNAKNAKEQHWDVLAFEFFPSDEAFCEGVLVEDDGETTAYQLGEKRTCAYISRFDRVENCHRLVFEGAKGSFSGERACGDREVRLRIHVGAGRLARIRVNGEEQEFTPIKRDGTAFPLAFEGAAPDGDVCEVRFGFAVSEGAEVAVYKK